MYAPARIPHRPRGMGPHERRRTVIVSLAMALRQAVKSRSRSTRLTRFVNSVCSMMLIRIIFVIYVLFVIGFISLHGIPKIHSLQHSFLSSRKAIILGYGDLYRSVNQRNPTLIQSSNVDNEAIVQGQSFVRDSIIDTTARTTSHNTKNSSKNNTKLKITYNSKQYPRIILGFSIHGGVGNQIYDILEALYLVRHAETNMLLPTVLPRTDIEGEMPTSSIRTGSKLWDLRQLTEATNGRTIYPFLPSRCRGRIHIVYIFIRRGGHEPDTLDVPQEVRKSACLLARVAPNSSNICPKQLFAKTQVRVRRQNLTSGGDESFIKELRALRNTRLSGMSSNDQLCVWISGHTYDRAGAEGDEYLYSHMHFLSAHPRIIRIAKQWPLHNMAVLHIRYDEELCDVGNDSWENSHICVRTHKDGRLGNQQVYWAPITEYVATISENILHAGASSLYIAASPYVPLRSVMLLHREFAKHLIIQPMASRFLNDEADINFLERELAIQSLVFVADFGSTWSGTVYFKRRTLARTSLWANVLLGRATNLGYYAHNSPLEIPD